MDIFGCRLFAGGGARATGWFYQFSEDGAAGFEVVFQAENWGCDILCIGAGQADYADAAAAGRGGDSDDGVVEVHGAIVNWSSAIGRSRARVAND
jgi:hypothetical protein